MKNKKMWVLPALALAILIKYAAVVSLPIFILWLIAGGKNRPTLAFWLKTASICACIFVICYLPFWQGAETFRGVVIQAKLFGQPFFYPIKLFFNLFNGRLFSVADPLALARNVSLGLFAILIHPIDYFNMRPNPLFDQIRMFFHKFFVSC